MPVILASAFVGGILGFLALLAQGYLAALLGASFGGSVAALVIPYLVSRFRGRFGKRRAESAASSAGRTVDGPRCRSI